MCVSGDFGINAPLCHGFQWITLDKNAYNAGQSKIGVTQD